ncbi:sulfur carrier protein ThiS [Nitriliruptoraceae bacterium ZYF776]|nr:sulfur carrier protein ThiS [Profundirhabdus halotolerans]
MPTVNGRPADLPTDVTVGQLVDDLVPDRRGVAVALDGEVVPRGAWDATHVAADAEVEVVTAAQGG